MPAVVQQVLLAEAAAAGGTWQTTWTNSLTSDTSDFGSGTNIRQYFDASVVTTSGSKVRITFSAGSASNATLTSVYCGHVGGSAPNFDGTQIRVTFNTGSNSVTIPGGTSKVSDDIIYSLDQTKHFMAAMFLNGGAGTGVLRQNFSTPTSTRFTKATTTDESAMTSPAGYGSGAVDVCVSKIEVFV